LRKAPESAASVFLSKAIPEIHGHEDGRVLKIDWRKKYITMKLVGLLSPTVLIHFR